MNVESLSLREKDTEGKVPFRAEFAEGRCSEHSSWVLLAFDVNHKLVSNGRAILFLQFLTILSRLTGRKIISKATVNHSKPSKDTDMRKF